MTFLKISARGSDAVWEYSLIENRFQFQSGVFLFTSGGKGRTSSLVSWFQLSAQSLRPPRLRGECFSSNIHRRAAEDAEDAQSKKFSYDLHQFYWLVAGSITRSARNGPISVDPVILSGRRLLSSLIHMRNRYLSLCGSSVVSESAMAGIFCEPN